MAGSTQGTPVIDLLANMTLASVNASSLDPETLMIARLAALAAVGAPAISYKTNFEAAVAVGIDVDRIRGILTAIAPIVGAPRVATALIGMGEALELEIEDFEAGI